MGSLALFDLDDTLIALSPAFRRFARDFARQYALPAEAEDWLFRAWDPYQRRDEFFARVRERYGLAESVEDLWRLYRTRMPEFVELRDEVRDGLVAMRRAGWRLGIVTNGEADNQLGKVERTGLDRLVDSVAVSGALGIRKPDAEIFRIAAEGAGCALADGGWMVGDNAHADIEGGAAVGLRTVWVDGIEGRWDVAPAATVVVKDVVEAFPILLTRPC
ncbi:HAD-superfamily hydrolase, subfamily IA, variant 1 [Catenulispora acidiphila DSM 44928]|uniref:HAD-superfamily hydrolase, subfamily IA, variant 1 n=1 Tax=Catenulispora acidiphila (strain DSM 44928 / JCM 14897 / NBRC 102108 / NRRL B-24433 / ID139908) TaxID=479433 RepID=C7Q9G9_CATAD|nr:HAD family hydrolase [Catenulispora acidiphila]ACU74315.1 HAD-superfamily hydrolase, subfamily IA, variant 1 [Catenulispora acidiphila DSM 44928]